MIPIQGIVQYFQRIFFWSFTFNLKRSGMSFFNSPRTNTLSFPPDLRGIGSGSVTWLNESVLPPQSLNLPSAIAVMHSVARNNSENISARLLRGP